MEDTCCIIKNTCGNMFEDTGEDIKDAAKKIALLTGANCGKVEKELFETGKYDEYKLIPVSADDYIRVNEKYLELLLALVEESKSVPECENKQEIIKEIALKNEWELFAFVNKFMDAAEKVEEAS